MIYRNFFSSEKSSIIISDRFIPVRNPHSNHADTLQFLLEEQTTPESPSKVVSSGDFPSVSDLLIRDCLSLSGQKLFTYSRTPKQQRLSKVIEEGFSGKPWNGPLSNKACQCRFQGRTVQKISCGREGCLARARPEVANLPVKILDAPGMTDDFYLDVLDWSEDGTIALGIEDKVFFYQFASGTTKEFFDLQKVDNNRSALLPVLEEPIMQTPQKRKSFESRIETKSSLAEDDQSAESQEEQPTNPDILYLSFEDSEFSEEEEEESVVDSPITPQKQISFLVEGNYNEQNHPPFNKRTRKFSIFEEDTVPKNRGSLDSLEGIQHLNFDGILDQNFATDQEEEIFTVNKKLFDCQPQRTSPALVLNFQEGPNPSPKDENLESNISISELSFSLQEESDSDSDSIVSEESVFGEGFESANPFIRSNTFIGRTDIMTPEQIPQERAESRSFQSSNGFLMSQVSEIVNQNFLESPGQQNYFDQPRLAARESLLQGKNQVIALKFNASGKILAVVDAKGFLYLIDKSTGQVIQKQYFQEKICTICWSGNRMLALGDQSGKISLLDTDRPLSQPLMKVQAHSAEICKLSFSTNGTYLASSGNDKQICAIDLGRLKHHFYSLRNSFLSNLPEISSIKDSDVIRLGTFASVCKALVWHPTNSRLLFTGGGVDDRRIRIFDAITKKQIFNVEAGSQVCSLAFDKSGKTLLSTHGFSENVLRLWDVNTLGRNLKRIKDLTGHADRVLHLAASPCGKFVVSGSGDETLRIWECFHPQQARRAPHGNFMKRGIARMR